MKVRSGFVSNSSSSSFVLWKADFTKVELDHIIHYRDFIESSEFKDMCITYCKGNVDSGNFLYEGILASLDYDEWVMNSSNYSTVSGYCLLDNFDLNEYFNIIGLNNDLIDWT